MGDSNSSQKQHDYYDAFGTVSGMLIVAGRFVAGQLPTGLKFHQLCWLKTVHAYDPLKGGWVVPNLLTPKCYIAQPNNLRGDGPDFNGQTYLLALLITLPLRMTQMGVEAPPNCSPPIHPN